MRLLSLSAGLAAALAGLARADDASDLRSTSLKTHSLEQPYLDSPMQSRWFDFGGDTIVRTDSFIRLTSDRPSQSGWLFSRVPLTATNWEVEVEFRIHGRNSLVGDGMAMWITKQRAKPGPVFGAADNFEGLGIFIDTYRNNRPAVNFPYVMAMYGDGKTRYDKDHDGMETELAGCSAQGIRGASIPTKLRLTYLQDKQLKLELQYKTKDSWELCFDEEKPPAIPNIAYLGFSSETGELSDNHDIISVTSNNLYNVPGSHGSGSGKGGKGAKGKKKKKASTGYGGGQGGGSWTWFFTKIILIILVAGAAYVGFTVYRTRSRSHRF